MGDDPKLAPLNRWCQAHEVKNLFVADAAPFNGNPDKNVTLTIVALAWRTSEFLAEEMRKGMSNPSRRDVLIAFGGKTASSRSLLAHMFMRLWPK